MKTKLSAILVLLITLAITAQPQRPRLNKGEQPRRGRNLQ